VSKPRVRVPARRAAAGGRGGAMAALGGAQPYDAADTMTAELAAWRPHREQPDSELGWARAEVTARARDLVRNNGHLAGHAQKEVDAVLGADFRPSAKPGWRALNITREQARAVAAQMEAAWDAWASDPRRLADVTRSQDWGGMAGLAYRSYLIDGDALGVLHWEDAPRPGWGWSTRLRVADPDLLGNPSDAMDTLALRGGVELDAHGAAIAYHFRREHPLSGWGMGGGWSWDRVERETPWGRPVVVHHFDKQRDGQTRGVSRLASIAEAAKMGDKHQRVALQQAVLSAILGLFVSSQMDGEAVAELLDDGKFADGEGKYVDFSAARMGIHSGLGLTFGGVRLPVLPVGDTIQSVQAAQPSAAYDAFETSVLRRIAAGLGTSYEQLAADWSKTNYSSARAALNEIWRGLTARRRQFATGFCDPVRMAVMEEAVAAGRVVLPRGAPELMEAPAHWLRAKWIGPGRGYVDPVKEAQAAALRVQLGLSTMEDEAAELAGADYEENLDQIAREIEQMPAGVLHPAQEKFAALLGVPGESPPDAAPPAAA